MSRAKDALLTTDCSYPLLLPLKRAKKSYNAHVNFALVE